MARPTIRDLSKEAGVSAATVSRVLNRRSNVSKDVEQKVLEAQQRLGYSLPKKEPSISRVIAVVLPRLSNPFYYGILDGIEETAVRRGYKMVVSQVKSEYGSSSHPFRYLSDDSVDGLITLEHADGLLAILKNVPPTLPVVQCCEYNESLPYPYVAVNDYSAARNAVAYLCATGRTKIALLNMSTRSMYGRKREKGYRDALVACGLPVNEDYIHHLNNIDFSVAYSTVCELLSKDDKPDAFFTVSDVYAIAATRAARKMGLEVPRDIAVVGFDNIEMAAMNEPPLTTVNQPKYEIGSTACSMLIEQIENRGSATRALLLDSDLIVRSST